MRNRLMSGIAAVAVASGLMFGVSRASAQQPGEQPIRVEIRGGVTVCSTTDYTDVAAKALGLTASELRVALAGGKSLQDLATAKSVDIAKVTEALTAARNADIDQAVKDGLLTQEEADAMKKAMETASAAGNQRGGRGMGMGIVMPLMGGINIRNNVKPYVVAAEALKTTCADLVKALDGGKSIAQYATEKGVALQSVIDPLVKAFQDAIDKDLSEGLIAKAVVENEKAQVLDRVLQLISGRGMGRGEVRITIGEIGPGRPGFPGQGGQGGRDNRPGQPGQPGRGANQPGQPGTGAATPEATPSK